MVYVLADNIISPLGTTSEENYQAVKAGNSAIRRYAPMTDGVPEGFMASLLLSDFEELVFSSVNKALRASGLDATDKRVVFILSSTKGAVEELGKTEEHNLYLGETAQHIATRLGFRTRPIVVCQCLYIGFSSNDFGRSFIRVGKV